MPHPLRSTSLLAGLAILAMVPAAHAQDARPQDATAARLAICARMEADARLACFDAVARASTAPQARTERTEFGSTDHGAPPEMESAKAQPDEAYVVGIYEPLIVSTTRGQEVSDVVVRVDRPGKLVSLMLTSYEATPWAIVTSPGTHIDQVFLGGHGAPRSEVTVNGRPFKGFVEKTGSAYKLEDPKFPAIHQTLIDRTGVDRASGHLGSYRAPAEGFTISTVNPVKTLADEAKDLELAGVQLPPRLAAAVAQPGPTVRLTDTGFVGQHADGSAINAPLPVRMPQVSWPMGATYDAAGGMLYGVTMGGEGFLYAYDLERDQWSAYSMNRVDVGGIIFDPETKTLVTLPGRHGMGSSIRILDRTARVLRSFPVKPATFKGMERSFDPSNGRMPSFTPLAIADGTLLVELAAETIPDLRTRGAQPTPRHRYLVDLKTGVATPVADGPR